MGLIQEALSAGGMLLGSPARVCGGKQQTPLCTRRGYSIESGGGRENLGERIVALLVALLAHFRATSAVMRRVYTSVKCVRECEQ